MFFAKALFIKISTCGHQKNLYFSSSTAFCLEYGCVPQGRPPCSYLGQQYLNYQLMALSSGTLWEFSELLHVKAYSPGFWHKKTDTASEGQEEKAPQNVLELRQEGFRCPDLYHGPVTETFHTLPNLGVFERSQGGSSHVHTEMVIISRQCFLLGPF